MPSLFLKKRFWGMAQKTERKEKMESKSAKDSFIMRHNWIENMRELSAEDFKEMILAIHEFAQDGKVPEFDGFKMLAWKEYQAKLQDDKDKYFEICERNKANGSLGGEFGKFGGRPRKTPNGDMKTPNGDMKTPNGDMKTPNGDMKTPNGRTGI